MKDLPKSARRWLLVLAIVLGSAGSRWAVPAQLPAASVPERLEGRKSYLIQAQPFLSKSEISAKFTRPRSVAELLRNLNVAWTDRLLVEPNFYDDSILMTCFNGTALAWKDQHSDPTGEYSNRVAEIKLSAGVFPQAVVVVRLYRKKVQTTNKSQPYFPAHQHYIGYLDLSVKGIAAFTWEEVTHVFGQNATSLPLMGIDGPGLGRPGSVALMRYSYPGDDPTKFGYLELPQTEIWLSGGRPDAPSSRREGPRGSDNVTRIFMLEASNRTQGEE